MSGTSYMILAYTAGLGLFWAYAAATWQSARAIDRRSRLRDSAQQLASSDGEKKGARQ